MLQSELVRRVCLGAPTVRFAVGICSVALLVALAYTSGAAYAVEPGQSALPATDAVMSRAQATASVGSEELAYYEKHFGVSAQVATERLASQLLGQGVEAALTQRYGDAIPGVLFNNSTGKWEVAATSAAPSDGIATVFSTYGLTTGDFQVNTVTYTRPDLLKATETLESELSEQDKRGVTTVGYGGGTIKVTVASDVSEADKAAIEKTSSAVASTPGAPPVDIVSAPTSSLVAHGEGLSCSFPFCNQLVAGAEYYGDGYECTQGWYGEISSSAGTTELELSAGHCAVAMGGDYATVDTTVPSHGEHAVGFGFANRIGEGGDWGSLNPSLPEKSPLEPYPFPGYYNWAGGYGTYLQYWYTSGSPSEGTILCHQGVGSGQEGYGATQCGVTGPTTHITESDTLHGVHYEWHLNPVLQVNSTVICGGDSGGPWFLQSASPTAVGIEDAGSGGLSGHPSCGVYAWMTTTSEINTVFTAGGFTLTLFG